MAQFALKIIALICMTIDHIGEFLPNMPVYFRWIGRLAAPLFTFCAVEGWTHTHSRRKYLLRLYVAGVVMSVVQCWFNIDNNYFRQIFSMCLLFAVIDEFRAKSADRKRKLLVLLLWQLGAIAVCFLLSMLPALRAKLGISGDIDEYFIPAVLGSCFNVEGGWIFTVGGVVLYLCRGSRKRLALGWSAYCGGVFLLTATDFISRCMYILDRIDSYIFSGPKILSEIAYNLLLLCGISEEQTGGLADWRWMMLFSLPLMLSYNGKPGRRSKAAKWFFYVFYPAHIIVLNLLNQALF